MSSIVAAPIPVFLWRKFYKPQEDPTKAKIRLLSAVTNLKIEEIGTAISKLGPVTSENPHPLKAINPKVDAAIDSLKEEIVLLKEYQSQHLGEDMQSDVQARLDTKDLCIT